MICSADKKFKFISEGGACMTRFDKFVRDFGSVDRQQVIV
jgi:hypothetical protein